MRKIDALIAEHALGWKPDDRTLSMSDGFGYMLAPDGCCGKDAKGHQHIVPDFSTDMADTEDLIEEIRDKFAQISIDISKGLYSVTVIPKKGGVTDIVRVCHAVMPMAVCLAILEALGAEIQ
jgi:hypothetical protein